MAWVETESLSFVARHDSADAAAAQRTLDDLEDLRLRLEDRFDEAPGEITRDVHPNPVWLAAAHPFLPPPAGPRRPPGRRYLAGWAMATELHVLNDDHLDRRAGGRRLAAGAARHRRAALRPGRARREQQRACRRPGDRAASRAICAGPG